MQQRQINSAEELQEQSRFRSGRDEMNLAEFPLTVLSTRVNPDVKTLEFTDTQRLKNGELIERQWIITGADKFGLPTATDDDVVLGLICLTMDQGFRHRKVYFTRYELMKILRWSTEGRSYSRLTKSLDRLSGVRIRASNAFFDNDSKSYQTRNFGIIDAYEVIDERKKPGEEQARSYFIWSEAIFDSFKAGFIKKIDLDFYFSLKSSVSRRLYRYLDKHFYFKSSVEKPLMTLAFTKLGLSKSYKYVSSVKQQLEPACEELCERGFLSSYEYLGRGEATLIRFNARPQNGAFAAPRPAKAVVSQRKEDGKGDRESLAHKLVQRGLSPVQVEKLLGAKDSKELEQVEKVLEYYDSITAHNKTLKNRVGFLYRAVENPFKFLAADRGSNNPSSGSSESQRSVPAHKPAPLAAVQKKPDSAAQEQYKVFINEELTRIKKNSGGEPLRELYTTVEERLACLKGILEPLRYVEAIEGCVKDELVRRGELPDFKSWQKSQ